MPRPFRARSVGAVSNSDQGDASVAVPVWAVVGSAAVTVLIAVDVVRHGPLSTVDRHLSSQMLDWGLRYKPWPHRLLTPGLWFGQRGTVLTGATLLALLAVRRRRTVEPLVRLFVALCALSVVVYAFKLGLGRNAPIGDARGQPPGSGASFPSGHTANAVLLWGLAQSTASRARMNRRLQMLIAAGRWSAPWIVSAVMVLLDYHWLTDLVAGMTIGIVLLWVTLLPAWDRLSVAIDRRIFGHRYVSGI